MKNFCYFFISLLVFSGFFPEDVSAQQGSGLLRMDNSIPSLREPRFIESIEITGGEAGSQTTASQAVVPPVFLSSPATNTGISVIEQCRSLQFKYALLMDRNVESVSNHSLYRFIDDWWGTRYRYGGHTRKGIDCSAFSGRLYADVFGRDLPRTSREQFQACRRIDMENMAEGDLVFFNTRGGVSHVGVYLGDGYFVHSSTNDGVKISRLDEDYYRARFIAAGRLEPASLADACVPGQPECQD